MKIYYPKDKNGNEIAFRTPENFVYDTTGESLSTKLENLSSSIGNIKGSVSDDVTALDKKFTEAIENRATNSDLEIERRRIDNIANLSRGSTTGDAELIDIRTMTDGTIAANAGTAVRTQIKNLITSESNKTGTTKMTYKLGTEQAMPDIIEYSQLINDLSEEVYSETLSNSGKGYLVDENKNVRVNDIVSVKCDADKQDGLTIVIRYNDGTADKHITTLNNMLVTSEMKTIEVSTTKTATFIVKRINSNEKNGLILSAIENMRKELYINLLNGMHLTTGDIGTGGNYVDNDNSYRSTGYSDLSYEKKTEIDHDLPVFLLFTSDYNITIKVFYYEKHTRTLNQSMTKTYTYTSGSRTQIKLLPNYYNKFVFTFNDSNVPSIFDFTKASFLSYEYERFDIQNYIPLTTGKGGWEWKNINTAIAPYVEPRLANITNRLPLIVNQVDELKSDLTLINELVVSVSLEEKIATTDISAKGGATLNGNHYTSTDMFSGINGFKNGSHYKLVFVPEFEGYFTLKTILSGVYKDTILPSTYIPDKEPYVIDIPDTIDFSNASKYIMFLKDNTYCESADLFVYDVSRISEEVLANIDFTTCANPVVYQSMVIPDKTFKNGLIAENILYGKDASFLGDSLTQNGSGGQYIAFVKDGLGLSTVHNCGIGGTRVSGGNADGTSFWTDNRVNSLSLDSDCLFIMGGTNDAPYTTVQDSDFTIDNHDTNNFIGAYNVLISKVLYKYLKLSSGYYSDIDYSGITQVEESKPYFRIILITPPKRFDSLSNLQGVEKFTDYVIRIAEMWGIPVCDVNHQMNMNIINKDIYFSENDYIHFGVNAHKELANIVIGKVKSLN